MQQALTGGAAALIAVCILYLGRRDLTRPSVVFGTVWFGFVGLAQLRLTEQETPWGTDFTILVFAGGLAFVVAALVAAGTAPARGTVIVRREQFERRRLVWATLFLIACGAAGAAWKAHILGGVPLLSGEADVLRARAFGNGEVATPMAATALTDCFFLALWCALIALWKQPRGGPRRAVVGLVLLAAVALFGVALEASRNPVLLSVAIPAVAVYLLARPRRRRAGIAYVGIAALLLAGLAGGAFVLRLAQNGKGGHEYLTGELHRQPTLVQPLVPIYVNGVFPLEAAHRIYDNYPDPQPFGLGAYSLLSLPDAAYPKRKPSYGPTVVALMEPRRSFRVPGAIRWAVASYQGRLFADDGWPGVILGSVLLGLGFGWLYRWARARTGFVAVAVIGYLAYYAAYMVYDNLLSFTLIAVFDLVAIALVVGYVRGDTRALVASLRRLADQTR